MDKGRLQSVIHSAETLTDLQFAVTQKPLNLEDTEKGKEDPSPSNSDINFLCYSPLAGGCGSSRPVLHGTRTVLFPMQLDDFKKTNKGFFCFFNFSL